MPLLGHSQPSQSPPVGANVRYASNSDQIGEMPRTTLSAQNGPNSWMRGRACAKKPALSFLLVGAPEIFGRRGYCQINQYAIARVLYSVDITRWRSDDIARRQCGCPAFS